MISFHCQSKQRRKRQFESRAQMFISSVELTKKTEMKERFFSSFRIFGIRCSRCKMFVQPNESIMKTSGQLFHLQCFRCSVCDDVLNKGDPYMYRDGLLLCHADFQHDLQQQQQQNMTSHHHHPHPTMRCNRSLFSIV